MKYYLIRYKAGDKIKSISILAKSPEGAKSIFLSSNPFAEIITCVKA